MPALKKHRMRVDQRFQGMRLDQALTEWLGETLSQTLSRAKARQLIMAGAVYLNGKRTRIASKPLLFGAYVEAWIDDKRLFSESASREAKRGPFELRAEDVLFEDAWLIAVNKPAGLPTQATLDQARDHLFAAVKRLVQKRQGGEVYVGLHHRLDRDTSGVVLFTLKAEANAGTAALFQKHLAQKTYWAVVELKRGVSRREGDRWEVRDFLARDSSAPAKRARYRSVRSGGDPAHTRFRCIATDPTGRFALVEAQPLTGRTHQIRVHLSEAGYPIFGDGVYGGSAQAARMLLHAASLTFPHPISNVEISVSSPLPADFLKWLQDLKLEGGKTPSSGRA